MSCTGALDLWTMEIDGKTVAVEFGLVRGDTRYSMQAGFDPAFARSQVGMLLDVRIIESTLARGLRYCDFLHGQQDYKVSLGVGSSQYLNIRCAPPRSPGAAWVRASSMPALQKLWSLTGRSGVPKPI
jgi:CelD/BcsL family acetyltransferase involved in cellulose biosynthesis